MYLYDKRDYQILTRQTHAMNTLQSFNLSPNDPRWPILINQALQVADHMEFNVLYLKPGQELEVLLQRFSGMVHTAPTERYYYSGKRIRFPISPGLTAYVKRRKFENWINFVMEDPAFTLADQEILATISHEMMCGISPLHFPAIARDLMD
ncbi:MAG: hypothetical protein KDC54_20835 [Lewinella sp.]|nr:hypothetical protein [Lewinella sp.]